uniref:Uncharacterized protein n=1 Tax=viral metagenome TaxID=1070528 RepID=A0A6M3J1K1_9ZZZZ
MEQIDRAVQMSEDMNKVKTAEELDSLFDKVAFNDAVSDYQDWLYWEYQSNVLRLKLEKEPLCPKTKPY